MLKDLCEISNLKTQTLLDDTTVSLCCVCLQEGHMVVMEEQLEALVQDQVVQGRDLDQAEQEQEVSDQAELE